MSDGEALYLAIDQGGHASRALVFDARGREHASSVVAIDTRRLSGERVEHDPEALVASVEQAVAGAVARLGAEKQRLCAAGLATQRSSIVCWDARTGAALSPVISWQDRRAANWLARFDPHARRVHEITGLVLSPHYGASKLRWCLDELEAVRAAQAEGHLVCGPLASFLLFRLTRERSLCADPCNASRTLLWDLAARDWSDELLALFGVPRSLLPACGPNAGDLGDLRLAELSVPIRVCTGDQPAALFAFGVPDPRIASVNAGTGAFLQCVTGSRPQRADGLLTSLAWQANDSLCYVLEGTVNGAGSAIAWAAEALGLDAAMAPQGIDTWMRSKDVPPLFLNGVSGLGAPWWVSDFESRFIGEGSVEARMLAVVESIAFLLMRNLDAMRACGMEPAILRLTGGLAASEHFTQLLSDLSGLPVERPEALEATARGLAFLLADAPSEWAAPRAEVSAPRASAHLRDRYTRWLEAMRTALRPIHETGGLG